jgi:hypothetical protein
MSFEKEQANRICERFVERNASNVLQSLCWGTTAGSLLQLTVLVSSDQRNINSRAYKQTQSKLGRWRQRHSFYIL